MRSFPFRNITWRTTKCYKMAMNLKQFLIRQEVLALYRKINRALRQVPDEKTKQELREWARTDFRKNMHETDTYIIKSLLREGEKDLDRLECNLALSKSQPVEKE